MKNIHIQGARIHNLKNIDIDIPKNQLVVATGISGSGKSSLVFDIVFEEGRRQYLQSLGILTGIDDEEKFDSISGISPAIAVQQSVVRQSNPRSTVGSNTGLINMLAVLYSGEGQMFCRECDTPLQADLSCSSCGSSEERLPASYFSYLSPNGMCLKCSGRGAYFEIDMDKLAPENSTTLQQVFGKVSMTPGYTRLMHKKFGTYLHTPFMDIPDEIKEDILYGHYVNSNGEKRSYCLMRAFQGNLYWKGEDLSGIYTRKVCADCAGSRVGEEARRVSLNGKHIGELGQMSISELHSFLETLSQRAVLSTFGKNLLDEILRKTASLMRSRLGYLSLYREMPTLSGGELQRLYLNAHLASKMDSLIYILDEPTVGLHPSEKVNLLDSIKALKELGNTVIVVEHDRSTIEMAGHIIDMGPGAGVEGGRVLYQGGLAGLLDCPESLTGRYLSGRERMPDRTSARLITASNAQPHLCIRHVKTNNLKDVTVSFPLGALVGVAGVSGSGKSSLISDTLVPMLRAIFQRQNSGERVQDEEAVDEDIQTDVVPVVAESLEGVEHIAGCVEVSQAPIGRNLNSNPASYLGIWDKIRKLFAAQPDALEQGLAAGHFSFNSKGACSSCGGSGREKIWLGGSFFIYKTCPACQGKRFNPEALSVRYRGKNIVDILEMSVAEALPFFEGQPGIESSLAVMERIGMGYIGLGQPTPTLSGGEAQRIKLAREIGSHRKGNLLYVLDEPTGGLSLYDTARLIQLLDELVAKGNSVIVIEHDCEVLNSCDWLIELGPQGGAAGGSLIAEGSPQMLRDNPQSLTGRYL